MRVLGELSDAEAILHVSGEVDIVAAPELRDAMARAFDYGAVRLVLDCSDLTFMDSSGLGALVEAHARAQKEDRAFVLRNLNDSIMKLLETTGLHVVLRIAPA